VDLYDHGKYQQALQILVRNKAAPDDGEVHLWLGKAYLKLRRWDDAIRELQETVRIDPSNGAYHLWLGRAYGEKASHVFFLSSADWARKAVQEFETAVKLSPHNMESRFDLLEFYLEAPGFLGGGKHKASAEAKEIAAMDPMQGYRARAIIYQQAKKWAEGREQLAQATAEFPNDAVAFTNLADFLFERLDYAGAESSARKALELDRGNIKAQFILSAAAVGLLRDLPAAQKSLSELTTRPLADSDPGFEDVYYWLGRAYQEDGKPAEARQAFQTALKFNPEHKRAKAALLRINS
jgi:tetratricopeptide (TPR) repeat protein